MKPEINNRKKMRKFQNTWTLNHILCKNPWVKEEMLKVLKYTQRNKIKIQCIKICRTKKKCWEEIFIKAQKNKILDQ